MRTTNVLTDTETAQAEPVGPPARPGTLRRVLARRRSDRRGALGSTEMVQLIGVILLIALLAGGTFVYLRFIRGSSENSVVQRNIDEVAKMADAFWQSYSADTDGRRKIDLNRFCKFANSQLAEDDLNLRTLQYATDGGSSITPADGATAGEEMTPRILVRDDTHTNAPTTAACLTDPTKGDADIIALDDTSFATIVSDGDYNASPNILATAATTYTEDAHKLLLESGGLLSTASVWMAQYGDGSPEPLNLAPPGTDAVFTATQTGVEVLVFGGMAPSGDSFCLIKVFDASDADDIGEYRVSRLGTDDLQFATCLGGYNASGANEPRRGGQWPEPQ